MFRTRIDIHSEVSNAIETICWFGKLYSYAILYNRHISMFRTEECSLLVHCRHLQHTWVQPILGQEKVPLDFSNTGINPPRAKPVIVIEEDHRVIVRTDQALDLAFNVSHALGRRGLGML